MLSLQFSAKNWSISLKNNVMILILQKNGIVLYKKRHFLGENIFQNHDIGPKTLYHLGTSHTGPHFSSVIVVGDDSRR
jgi:hypothetical protein